MIGMSVSRCALMTTAALSPLCFAQPSIAQANTSGDMAAPAVSETDEVQTPDQQTQSADDTPAPETNDEVVVTGYRRSLQSSTNAKRNSVGFTDSIFAEDIGKFPDTNIAESFNRVPGITISREITGEGLRVSIRGLGTNFTRVTLNNAPIMVGSTGRTDDQGTNREVDLDIFPTELFTRLTVSKSPAAAMLEGGAAGIVDMRSARPFDNRGTHFVYSLQGTKNSNSDKWGHRGSLLASHTMGDFGILAGIVKVKNKIATTGFETIGWTNPNLSATQSTSATRNSTGGGNWTIPGTVPSNANIPGVAAGTAIDEAFLLARNPGANITQIDNGIIPRLGRFMAEYGGKDRLNAIAALEYKGDKLHAYIDSMYGRKKNAFVREAMTWVGRNGAVIPVNTTFDRDDCTSGCVVNTGEYHNAQWFLEFRPYRENLRYFGINPGLEFTFSDTLKFDLNANYTKSRFHRESPTVMPATPINSGVTVDYDNTVGPIPAINTNVDLNDPANFGWAGGRLNIQDERRRTYTKGVRGSATWGDPNLNLHVGSAYDIVYRRIRGFDASQQWQNAVCGNNPSVFLPGPNTQPPCEGLSQTNTAQLPANYPRYPAFGTGFTAGQTGPVTYGGSLVPTTALPGFLMPGPNGYITVDWDAFRAASNYDAFHDAAPETGGSNTGASGGALREKTWGIFGEVNGDVDVADNRLVFNAGVRWVKTKQSIGGRVSIPDPLNSTDPDGAGPLPAACPGAGNVRDGSCYPNIINFVFTEESYTNWLPSASAAYHIGEHAVVRAALSKTMTRPNPANMLPGLNFSSPSADIGSVGNPALDPYISKNIDLGFEYYTGQEGYFGIAAFRKSIVGFTQNGNTTVPFSSLSQYGVTFETLSPTQQSAINARGGPNSATVVLTQQVNAPGKLNINGLEFNWVQPLDFLLGRFGLNGFGFNANLTLVDQSGTGTAAGTALATGVPPRSRNITGYYENHGISLRLSNTYSKGFQASGPNQNGISAAALFSDDYHQWDFAGSLELSEILGMRNLPDLTLDVQNITKEAQRSYFQFDNSTFTYYKPGRIVMVGLRGQF